jgi:hypothetical protein
MWSLPVLVNRAYINTQGDPEPGITFTPNNHRWTSETRPLSLTVNVLLPKLALLTGRHVGGVHDSECSSIQSSTQHQHMLRILLRRCSRNPNIYCLRRQLMDNIVSPGAYSHGTTDSTTERVPSMVSLESGTVIKAIGNNEERHKILNHSTETQDFKSQHGDTRF